MAAITDITPAGTTIASATDDAPIHTARLLAVSASHAVHDSYTTFLAPLLPYFVVSLGISKTQAGLLPVIRELPCLLQPLMGHMGDRINLRTVIFLAPAVTAIFMSAIGIAPNYLVLSMSLLVAGTAAAMFHAVAPTVAGSLAGRRHLGRVMGVWTVGGEIGFTLGPLIVTIAVQTLGLRGTPWLMIFGVLASVSLFFLLRTMPERAVAAAPHSDVSFWQAFRTMVPVLLPLSGVVVARAFMTGPLTTFLPLYLVEKGAGPWFAGVSISIVQGAGTLGALLGGSISDVLGRRATIAIATALTPVFMFIFLASSGWVRVPLLLVLGFLAMSEMPVLLALVQEALPETRGMGNGMYLAMNYLGRSVAAFILGALGDVAGLQTAFTVAAIVPLVALPFVLLLPKGARSE